MTATNVQVRSLDEAELGPAWAAEFASAWPSYRRWFLSDGPGERATYLASRRALAAHMPELVPTYERAVELAGGSDLAARFLSGYRPPAYIAGCSQAVFRDRLLVRNYDYSPELWDRLVARTAWGGRRVLGMSDCCWGLLDGINEAGLAVSLAFGGRRVVGDGFGIPIVLRYVLQVCDDVPDAIRVLRRVPVHMAYNMSILDASGAWSTVMLSPDRPPCVSEQRVVTNHQHRVEWHSHALATGSVDRLRILSSHVGQPDETESRFVRRFLEPPVYSSKHHRGLGTLYTAVYRPAVRRVSYLWPDQRWDLGFDDPMGSGVTVSFGAANSGLHDR